VEDLSLHILDIAENAIRAAASVVLVDIEERQSEDELTITVSDNGRGMSREELDKALDPFFTTKSGKGVGLGLPLLAQAAREAGGDLRIDSTPGGGTRVHATFTRSHIDCKPLGDVVATLKTLVAGHSEVDFRFRYAREGSELVFDTREACHAEADH
jgi:anti-sigma regulatory factor (Ser/Thr protein kinase)